MEFYIFISEYTYKYLRAEFLNFASNPECVRAVMQFLNDMVAADTAWTHNNNNISVCSMCCSCRNRMRGSRSLDK